MVKKNWPWVGVHQTLTSQGPRTAAQFALSTFRRVGSANSPPQNLF
jgi:hypothetical protein